MKLSFKKLFFILAFIFGLFAVLVVGKRLLVSLSLALFTAFILLPVVKKFESWGLNKLLSAFLPILMTFVIIGGGITLFSTQIMSLSSELEDFSGKILKTFTDIIVFINSNVRFIDDLNGEELIEKGKDWLKASAGSLVSSTFKSTALFITGLITIIIFTFLFLIYRKGLTLAFVTFGDDENRVKIFRMLKKVQSVGKMYLSGMFLLMIILGMANSTGLWIIGIDSPFLFGFLAAILSIVPYIGTTLGASIPVLYAFMSTDSLWVPIAVIILFWVIQTVESNFLSPMIVGSSLNVNALVAILSLLIGALVWGIAGMILFLPFVSMLKVICEEFDQLKPIAMIISNDISHDETKKPRITNRIKRMKAWFKNK